MEPVDKSSSPSQWKLALSRLAFYECSTCFSPFLGGRRECHRIMEMFGEEPNPADQAVPEDEPDRGKLTDAALQNEEIGAMINDLKSSAELNMMTWQEREEFRMRHGLNAKRQCGGCQGCKIHGIDGYSFKCRHCCEVASWFCFGNTHFCQSCHDRAWDFHDYNLKQFLQIPINACLGADHCPLKGNHPPNGQEYAISLRCKLCDAEKVKHDFPELPPIIDPLPAPRVGPFPRHFLRVAERPQLLFVPPVPGVDPIVINVQEIELQRQAQEAFEEELHRNREARKIAARPDPNPAPIFKNRSRVSNSLQQRMRMFEQNA